MQQIKSNRIFSLSVPSIAKMSLMICVYIVMSMVVNISIFTTNITLTFPFFILVALMFPIFQGMTIAVLGDLLQMTFKGQIGLFMWQFQIIPPLIILTVQFLKKYLLKNEDYKHWGKTTLITNLISIVSVVTTLIWLSYNSDSSLNVPSVIAASIIIGLYSISLVTLYFNKRNGLMKRTISILTISFLIIVIFSWIWGPYAYAEFLKRLDANLSHEDAYKMYPVFLTSRIATTPLKLMVWSPILAALVPLSKLSESSHYGW